MRAKVALPRNVLVGYPQTLQVPLKLPVVLPVLAVRQFVQKCPDDVFPVQETVVRFSQANFDDCAANVLSQHRFWEKFLQNFDLSFMAGSKLFCFFF